MAKITDLPTVDEIDGAELVPIVQNGVTKQSSMAALRQLIVPFLQYWYRGDPGPSGPANSTFRTIAAMRAAPQSNGTYYLAAKGGSDGGFANGPFEFREGDYTGRVDVIALDGVPISTGALVRGGMESIQYRGRSAQSKLDEVVSVYDTKYAGGAVGDGVHDDTAAITAALIDGVVRGRAVDMRGTFATDRAKFPGTPPNSTAYLKVIGEPVFVQLVPNSPCLVIQNVPLQQSAGHRFACTVIPHPDSDKSNPDNMAVDLTGFSTSQIIVRLGTASAYTKAKGRFHTVVFARSNSPFHYGNRIRLIANNVPAPKYGVRYGNGGLGASGNPNINTVSAWCVSLDTEQGDTLIDLGDTTQAIVEGPTLLEACPGALGIKLGNFTTVRDAWIETIGTDYEAMPTASTTPNNTTFQRCYFSGAGHVGQVHSAVGAPPTFEGCLGDADILQVDEYGSPIPHTLVTRSYAQPPAPSIAFTVGDVTITPDAGSLRHPIDHHGRTTYALRFYFKPLKTGSAQLRFNVPAGFEIETSQPGLRDLGTEAKLIVSLSDNLAGTDLDWTFATTNLHIFNVRVVLRATR